MLLKKVEPARNSLPHPARRAAALLLSACLAAALCACKQADLAEFIDTGLSEVLLRSASFKAAGAALSKVPSGTTITADLAMVNPKSFAVTYSLDWGTAGDAFSTPPPAAPAPSGATRLSYTFVLDPAKAEHRTIAFRLGKYVASINKTYDAESFSFLCDSPPNAPARVATTNDSGEKSVLAVLLPAETSDDDLSKLRISWRREGAAEAESAEYAISALSAPPSPNPFSSSYDCFFQSPDCAAGLGYEYSVTVIDAGGQESASLGTSSTANSFYVIYHGNGNSAGTAPAAAGYRYGASAVVAAPGSLAKTDYAFSKWTSAADGSGSSYHPGDSLTIPAGDTDLYAQWITNGTTLSFDLGSQAIAFTPASASVAAGGVLTVACSSAALVSGGSGWKWYLDGVLSATGSASYSWATAAADTGQHVVSCAVAYGGLSYSGSFRATVTQ